MLVIDDLSKFKRNAPEFDVGGIASHRMRDKASASRII